MPRLPKFKSGTLEDNYHFPSLDEVLTIMKGSMMMCFLDGYLGYNLVMVDEEDKLKISFTTKWGTFAYKRMPFGLINVGATIQREMDEELKILVNKCIVFYMDDLALLSKERSTHIAALKQFFNRCQKYNISLKPKKFSFRVTKGKLPGHIISKVGISIYPKRIEAILIFLPPTVTKSLNLSLGRLILYASSLASLPK